MSDAQAQRAIEDLYGDASVREELIDEEADLLLKWGESQIKNLSAQNLDDAAFAADSANLTRLIAEINRFVGKRSYLPPAEQTASLAEIARLAELLHYKVAPGELQAYAQKGAEQSNLDAITALTGMLKSGTGSTPEPAASTPAPEVAPSTTTPTPSAAAPESAAPAEEKPAGGLLGGLASLLQRTATNKTPVPPTESEQHNDEEKQ